MGACFGHAQGMEDEVAHLAGRVLWLCLLGGPEGTLCRKATWDQSSTTPEKRVEFLPEA